MLSSCSFRPSGLLILLPRGVFYMKHTVASKLRCCLFSCNLLLCMAFKSTKGTTCGIRQAPKVIYYICYMPNTSLFLRACACVQRGLCDTLAVTGEKRFKGVKEKKSVRLFISLVLWEKKHFCTTNMLSYICTHMC